MTPSIVAVGTAVPPTRLSQGAVRDIFAAQPDIDRRAQRLIHAAFDASAIEHRHTVLESLSDELGPGLAIVQDGALLSRTTAERNAAYRVAAPQLFAEAARDALSAAQLPPDAVTHVITVSCTGLFAPGPDALLVRDLGLDPHVQRTHHGFVGCAAALPALRAANDIVLAHPESIVLVVCAELCSLHIRSSTDPEQIVAASLFADGAAAAIVREADTAIRLELGDFATTLFPDGEDDMTWTIGDDGFLMTLTAEVPRLVGREVRGVVGDPGTVDAWAVHPGGRAVLDRVSAGLGLADDALEPSRRILRDHGNMSSATILFILRDLLEDRGLADGSRIQALAFGPGLTVETATLTRRDGLAE